MKRSQLIAGLIALAAIGWLLSGQIEAQDETAATTEAARPGPEEAALPQVRVRRQAAEPRTSEIVLRGRTAASRIVQVSAETHGTVAELFVKKGTVVEAGTPILRLSSEDREARLRQARALADQRRLEYEAASKLAEKGYRAETALADARAKLEEANAAVAAMEIDIEHTLIRAPFEGVVDTLPVEIGDFLTTGDPVATVVDLNPILIVGQLSERDVGTVTTGDRGSARLINGSTVSGTVRYISATADEATRTFRLELEVENPDRRIVQGLSSEIRLPVKELPAHLVSPAILTLADDGQLGVKTVNAEDVVEFHPVTIIDHGPEGVWIAGLPPLATVITVGQEFVVAGQRVEPVPERGLEELLPEAGPQSEYVAEDAHS